MPSNDRAPASVHPMMLGDSGGVVIGVAEIHGCSTSASASAHAHRVSRSRHGPDDTIDRSAGP